MMLDETQLRTWKTAQADNWFTSDQNLQRTLEFYDGTTAYRAHVPSLYRFGRIAATTIRDLIPKLTPPHFSAYDERGNVAPTIQQSAEQTEITQLIREAGMLTACDLDQDGTHLSALAHFYLSTQNGEIGQHVIIAQTAAIIHLLQQFDGHDAVLDALLTDKTAVLDRNGIVYGLTADYLLTHHSNQAQDKLLLCHDMAGVPLNWAGFKLLAAGKLHPHSDNSDNIDQIPIGKPGWGQEHLNDTVIPLLRLYRATACSAHARQAYMIAWSYATHMLDGQNYQIHNPHNQVLLTQQRSDAVGMASGTFHIARLLDDRKLSLDNPDLPAILRVAINLHAVRAAELAQSGIQNGFDVLGASGNLDTLSSLTRLQQDTQMYRQWMGTTADIMAELQRDFQQFAMYLPFIKRVEQMFSGLTVNELKQDGMAACEQIRLEIDAILKLPEDEITTYLPPLMARLTDLFYVGCMAVESGWERMIKQDRTKQRLAEFMLKRRVLKTPLADWREYPTWIGRLCHEIRPPRVDWDDKWDGMDDALWE